MQQRELHLHACPHLTPQYQLHTALSSFLYQREFLHPEQDPPSRVLPPPNQLANTKIRAALLPYQTPKPLGADTWLASVLPGVRQTCNQPAWGLTKHALLPNKQIVSAIPCNKAGTWQHTSSKLLASHYSEKSHNIDGQTLNRPTIHTDRQMASWRQNSWEFGDIDSLLWSRWHAPLGHLSPHRPLQLLCFHTFFRRQSCGGVPIAPSNDAVLIDIPHK